MAPQICASRPDRIVGHMALAAIAAPKVSAKQRQLRLTSAASGDAAPHDSGN